MGTERTVVELDLNEREAVTSARRVGRELDGVASKAERAQKQAGRVDRLYQKAQAKGLLSPTLLRGNVADAAKSHLAATRFGGAAAIGYLAAVGLGKAGELGSHMLELLEENPSFTAAMKQAAAEALAHAAEALADAIERNPMNGAVRFVYQAYRKARGFNATSSGEVWDTALNLRTSGIMGETSDVDAAIAGQAANRRAFLKGFEQQQAREAREHQRRLEERERAFRKIDEFVASRISGLQPVSYPTKLTPALQHRIEQEQELRERLRGAVLKVRLGAGVGS
ncbi:MAG: hypothetical protein ICCCNLDF_03699 [Planctomycetes bacterium]|nr:hypothetical protein [Planctomycetota bacterium]